LIGMILVSIEATKLDYLHLQQNITGFLSKCACGVVIFQYVPER
jgi:hypothetical protein